MKYDHSTQYYEERLKLAQSYPLANPKSKCLNFGCGPMILPGWMNIDKFYNHPEVVKADIDDSLLLAMEGTCDLIFSSHSLEHVQFHVAKRTLHRWFSLLKPGGKMVLVVPDLENTMKIMMDTSISFELRYDWYMLVMYGYQRDPNIPWSQRSNDDAVDPGQIHYCGFTKEWFEVYLKQIGFVIEDLWSYDGYDTPSLYVQAYKP